MNTARIAVDAGAVSPSRALAMVARASARDDGPLVVVSHRALAELVDELGGYEQAARRLLLLATTVGRPIAVNAPTAHGSQTAFIAPKGWSDERLRGWAAGHAEALEAQFGPATVRPPEDL